MWGSERPAVLRSWLDHHPVAAPVLIGGLIRIVAAWSGHGVFASDDYTHVIEMAWHWLDDPTIPFNSRIRSELAARLAWFVFEGCEAIGIREPEHLLHVLYTILGLYSLVAIPGIYALARNRFDESTARNAAWLMAVEAVLPRLSTRALISMMSIPPLVWGLVAADRAHLRPNRAPRNALIAGTLISIAALFRFQIGIVFFVVLVLLTLARRRALVSAALLAGGGVGLTAQIGLDLHAFGSFTPAPLLYVQYNMAESSIFGVGPWYSYFGMFVLFTLPPATFALVPGMWRAAKTQWIVSVPLLVFFVFHSAIPHKEERFLFPLIPLFFVLLAAGLVSAWRRRGWRRGLVRYFWVVNAALLLAATASDAHRNLTTPMLDAGRRGDVVAFYGVGDMLLPVFYLGESATRGIVVRNPEKLLARLDRERHQGRVRILFDSRPKPWVKDALEERARCGEYTLSYGDPVDRLLVWVNPIGNRRRRGAKKVIDCVFGGAAG